MKETIYTIPINEAFDTDCECPVCHFFVNEEKSRVEYSLGASMMEPDERILSNKKGYCRHHTRMMLMHGNKLSHALVLETRLKYIYDSINDFENTISKSFKKSLFGKKDLSYLNSDKFYVISETASSCVICDKLNSILKRFIANMFYLYETDEEFKNKFFSSKGFCFKHFELLLREAPKHLKTNLLEEFLINICKLEKTNLDRVLEDVNWFTKKFDYRYKDTDWKNSKDAVQRACLKTSAYVEE